MIQDPYAVLGVSKDASTEEIKSAYRKAAKKYHPDLHPDDPEAAKKMNEVNQAYDMLMNPEKYPSQTAYSSQQSTYGYSQSQSTYSDFDDFFRSFGFGYTGQSAYHQTYYQQAEEYIHQNDFQAALKNLIDVPSQMRNAQWYYLYAVANNGLSNREEALKSIRAAVQLDPQNMIYRQLLSQLEGKRSYGHEQIYRSPLYYGMRLISGIFILQIVFWILQFLFIGLAW